MNTNQHYPSDFDLAARQNNRDMPKPNEDYLICDTENRIFIVLDGITRVHKEYFDHPWQSAAAEVSRLFAENVHAYLKANRDHPDPEALMREAVRTANDLIRDFRSSKSQAEWGFYPGTLGIIAMIRDNRLHYLCNGDCIGMILRRGSKICFGEQLCLYALEIMKVSKDDRYQIYCNHPENPLFYSIFNGDPHVPEYCEYSFIDLCPDDMVFLASDGVKNYLKYERTDVLRTASAEELLELSVRFDSPPFGTYSDDKSLMRFIYR